jgi:hypothetical protein
VSTLAHFAPKKVVCQPADCKKIPDELSSQDFEGFKQNDLEI